MKFFQEKAFTLAEVLITLGIIGIIAVMVIPTIFASAQNAEYYNRFLKTYSTLINVSNSVLADYNGDLYNQFNNAGELMQAFASHLNVQKTCLTNAETNCWSLASKSILSGKASLSSIASISATYTNDPAMILTDGTELRFTTAGWTKTCDFAFQNYSITATTTAGASKIACDTVFADINGEKGPNRFGRDIFYFIIYRNRPVLADGVRGTQTWLNGGAGRYDTYCDETVTTALWQGGQGCGGKIFTEGGMNY